MTTRLLTRALKGVDARCSKESTSHFLLLSISWLFTIVVPMMVMAPSIAMAQASSDQWIAEPPRGLELDRAGVIQRFRLSDPALKLTDSQKAQIDKAAATLAAESTGILQRFAPQQDAQRIDQQGTTALNQARERFTNAVKNVLNQEQKQTWDAKRGAHRPPAEGDTSGSPRGPQRPRPRQ